MNVLYSTLITILIALLCYYSISFYKQVVLVESLEKELTVANKALSLKSGELEMCKLSLTPIINICEKNGEVDKTVEYIVKEIDRVEYINEGAREKVQEGFSIRVVDMVGDDIDRLLTEAYDRILSSTNQDSR